MKQHKGIYESVYVCIVLQSNQKPSKHARDLTRRSSTGISQITHTAGGKQHIIGLHSFPGR